MAILCVLALMLVADKDSLQPKIEAIQFCDNYHASTWKEEKVLPGQVFSIRYHLENVVKLGSDIKVECSFNDATGKQVLQGSTPMKLDLQSDKSDFWGFVNFVVPAAEPGKYQLVFKVHSKEKGIHLDAVRTLTVEPARLAFFMTSLTHDVQGQVAASPKHLLLFQPVTIRLGVCGLKVVDSKMQLKAIRQLLSPEGKVLDEYKLPTHEEIALLVPGQSSVSTPVTFSLRVPQAGEYLLRFIVEDINAQATITKDIPVRFLPPDAP